MTWELSHTPGRGEVSGVFLSRQKMIAIYWMPRLEIDGSTKSLHEVRPFQEMGREQPGGRDHHLFWFFFESRPVLVAYHLIATRLVTL